VEPSNKDYSFSLFKPVSQYGKSNRNLILTLLSIWVLAIFGFQLLLIVLEKPTPESSLIQFESVWESIKSGDASREEKEIFLSSLIAVSGKSMVSANSKLLLDKAMTYTVFGMISDSAKGLLAGYITDLHKTREMLVTANGEEYISLQELLRKAKAEINSLANETTGADPTNLKESILPYCLNSESLALTEEESEALEKDMKLYLTHNQSVLTDTKFLGFPFHYFYTSEFLLILFVLLSLFYSIRITQLQKKYAIKE